MSGRWNLASITEVMAPDASQGGGDPWLERCSSGASCRSRSESIEARRALCSCSWAFSPWGGSEGDMEFGGVGRVVGWFVTGTLRAATAVKLSRPAEVIAISRTADAIVAMLTLLGVDLLLDAAMARNRGLAML
jgi:hypothetical protein